MESVAQADVPSWLDNDYIQQLLREDETDESIHVQSMDVRFAVGKGENYMSVLYRIIVNLTKGGLSEQRALIVKSLSASEFFVKLTVDLAAFEKETLMYLETLPSMYQLEDNGLSRLKTLPSLSCKAYKTSRPFTIVMADLQKSGFKMADRKKGLDLKHSKLAMTGLARLHALSWGLVEKDPKCMDTYAQKFFLETRKVESSIFLTSGINLLAAEVEKWEGFAHYGEQLRKLANIDKMLRLFEVKNNRFAVLNHGDIWLNNMMYKYNESGEVEEIRFVDFQLASYVSLALDIQYFMHTSPNEEVRTQHWDYLIEEYHQAFVMYLERIQLGEKAPTLEEIKKEVNDNMFFGLYIACTVLPIVLADSKDAPDTSETVIESSVTDGSQSNAFSKMYSGLRFRQALQKILMQYENNGVLKNATDSV